MAQERWDVVLKVLNGPLSGLGEQVFRGPVVRIGVSPGPGGFQLTGYRGLDARQAVITAYDGGTAAIAPVGTNQVRMAPHPNVNWKEIDPISGPEYLNNGCAVHLGPVGRGATLEFVRCQRLGVWQKGDLASEAGSVSAGGGQPGRPGVPGAQPGFVNPNAPPTSYDARKVGSIRTSMAPVWFLGCLMLMATAATMLIVVLVIVRTRTIEQLGPKEPGLEFRDYAQVDQQKLEDLGLLDGLQQPFGEFVMLPNIEASGRKDLKDPSKWDQAFYDHVAAGVYQLVQWKNFFRRLEQIKGDYADVTRQMQEANLPEVFAAVPYRESTYKADMTSSVCAKGYWQFMPEVAYRLETKNNLDFKVRDCKFSDAPDAVWNPSDPPALLTPPPNVAKNAKYMTPDGKCRITQCRVDDRMDLEKSTAAAIISLGEAYNDDDLRQSGSVVQITIASHNAGYADGRFGKFKSSNLLPAFKGWAKTHSSDDYPSFYGDNIKCTNNDDPGAYCGAVFPSETQHYVYSIVAAHLLAVCYYGQNHADLPAFQRWSKYTEGDGYCTKFKIPRPNELN